MDYPKSDEAAKEMAKVLTENQKSIEEVSGFLKVEAKDCIKSLLFKVDDSYVLALVRGDHEVNDIKLKNLLGAATVELAGAEETNKILGCAVGSLGPIGVKDVEVIADHAVGAVVNGVCGANEENYHYINVNTERDFTVSQYADLRFIKEGDPSPDGQGKILFAKGIEVGHIFKLGTRYSEAMNAVYLDENGRTQPMIMGCYGIGVSRVMAAVAEQFNDERGLVWPAEVAPFQLHLIAVNMKDESQAQLAEELYTQLKGARYDVLFDDRQERPGVKFADSDLIGMPVRITVGKKAKEGIVEVKTRKTGDMEEVHIGQLEETIARILNA
jgi:prolyl-tRNA synthetase